ncbi:ABC transporter substrate-binding protein [bacterium]|nr:ABC transporter substrate-binding protein [bacterium]
MKFSSLIFLLLLSSCHVAPVSKDEIVVGIETYPQELDPRKTVEALPAKVFKLLYAGLFTFDEKLNLVPELAQSYAFKENRLEITLKSDVLFHDGTILTSADVKATYESLPAVNSPYAALWNDLDKIEAPDNHHVVFFLKNKTPIFLTQLTFPILKLTGNTFNPVGTGPYRLESTVLNEKVVLTRFDEYFGEKAKNKKIILRTILDDTLRSLELMKGRLDIVQNAVPPVLVSALEKEKNISLQSADGINFSYIGFNLKNTYLNNPKVRRAIALAIPRTELITYKLNGLATLATSILYPEHWAFNNTLSQIAFNEDEAKKMLDEAGLTDPDGDGPQMRFTLTYKTSTKKDRVDMAQIIAEYLRKIGIGVTVKPYEWGTFFYDIRTGNFEMYSLTMVGVTDPDIYYTNFHSSQMPPNGRNRGYYVNPTVDILLDKGRSEMDGNKRKEIYNEVQKIIFDDTVVVPLWYEKNYTLSQKNVSAYTLRPDAGFQGLAKIIKN